MTGVPVRTVIFGAGVTPSAASVVATAGPGPGILSFGVTAALGLTTVIISSRTTTRMTTNVAPRRCQRPPRAITNQPVLPRHEHAHRRADRNMRIRIHLVMTNPSWARLYDK